MIAYFSSENMAIRGEKRYSLISERKEMTTQIYTNNSAVNREETDWNKKKQKEPTENYYKEGCCSN